MLYKELFFKNNFSISYYEKIEEKMYYFINNILD